MNHAITNKMGHLFVVMKAVKRFKKLLSRRRPQLMDGLFGRESRIVSPPHSFRSTPDALESRSVDAYDRRPLEQAITREGVHRTIPISDDMEKLPAGMDRIVKITSHPEGETLPPVIYPSQPSGSREFRAADFPSEENRKGHARDPLKDTLYLDIGVDADNPEGHGDAEHPILSESPSGVDVDIYEQAWQDEMERVLQQRGRAASLYLNRRVEHREDLRSCSSILDQSREAARAVGNRAVNKIGEIAASKTPTFLDIVRQAREKSQSEAGAGAEDSAKPDEGVDAGNSAEEKSTT